MKLLITVLLITMSNLLLAATTADYLKDADNYLQKRDYKAAIIQLKNALQQEPSSAEARLKLGAVYLKIGNGPAAEKEYRRAKKHGALVEQWMPKLAEAMLIQGRGADVLRDINIQNEMSAEVKADVLGKRGQAYLMAQNISEAASSFDEALALDKGNAFALLGSARILASEKKFEDAAKQVDQALVSSPNNVIALTLRAELARQSGELEEAKNAYQKALGVFPRHIPALLGMASVHAALKEFVEATKFADQTIKINKDLPAPYYIKALANINDENMGSAESNLQRVLSLAPGHLPSLLIMGRIQYSNGNYEQADKLLRDFNSKISQHLPAIKLLAATRLKLKDLDGAKKILLKGEALDANDADILSMLGMAYSQTGEISKGSEYFERAAKISPEKANIQTQLGLSYLASGELDQAVSTLENAIKLDEGFERADIMLILAHLRKRDYDSALKAANAFAKKQPKNPMAYNFQGAAYGGKGDAVRSRKAFEKALTIKPDFSVAELNLARLDIKEKKVESAIKRFKNVIRREDDNINAHLGLAKLLLEQGNKEESLRWVKKIAQKQPGAIQPAVVLNRFYLLNKQLVKALDIAENLVSLYPASVVALEMLARSLIANDDIEDAINVYKTLVDKYPNNSVFPYRQGVLYLKLKQSENATISFRDTLRLDQSHLGANVYLANLFLTEGDYNEVKIRIDILKVEHGNMPDAWVVEGDMYHSQGKNEQAIESYAKALKKNGDNRVLFKLAKIYEVDKKPQNSERLLTDWLKKNPRDVAAHVVLGGYYQKHKKPKLAVELYKKGLQLAPNNLVLLNNLAWELTSLGDLESVKYAKRAYELSPANSAISDTYGWALVKGGMLNKGMNILKEASISAPHILEIKYHLAYAYFKNGEVDKAKTELVRLLNDSDYTNKDEARGLLKEIEQQ